MATPVTCPTCGTVTLDAAGKICPSCGGSTLPIDAPTRPAQRQLDPLRGVKLGEYLVEERIGIGGMGIVYRAVHPLIGNQVAIKVLRPDIISSEADLQRFLGEAKAINHIRHPGVVSIFGAGDTPDGRKYLVMELLQGMSLETLLKRETKVSTAEAVPILDEILDALGAVHHAGVVHRDLKPANVFLAKQSDGRRYVKLLDFGLARRSNNLEVSRVAGTPDYISPEHSKGKPPGPPADLYALGVMAFEMLTGRLPFRGTTAAELMQQHVSAPVPDASSYDSSIPPAMSALIGALMAKDPAKRPNAAQVHEALEAAARETRTAQTQAGAPSLRAREADTTPNPQMMAPGRGPDTEPQLTPRGGHTPLSTTPVSTTPLSPTPISGVELGAMRDTARELPRTRWRLVVLGLVGMALFAIALNAVLGSSDSEEPEQTEGKRPVPKLSALAPETDEPGAEGESPPVEPQPAEVHRDLRADLKTRLEKAQKLAHERKATQPEQQARKALQKLQSAPDADLGDLELQTSLIEAKLAPPR